jgi:Putative prokaryotic signal transducing protein
VSDDLVRLTVVANELEAEMVRSLLTTAGIESMQRYTDFGAGAFDGMPSGGGPREILVHAGDLGAARELIRPE